ncbi:DUF5665 domain-containing protein [Marinicrinis sediminis]|uniref:DUF5665 domain-containing protein n=1 Tax=Marinicrinis sediminis TaxID=1652465 RepID=A0ABW5R6Y0_9BACL
MPPKKDQNKPDEQRLEEQLNRFEEIMLQSRLRDIAYHFNSKKEVVKVNLIAGVARGVGLTLGTSIVLALLFFILSKIVSLPIVGEYIADLMDYVEGYRQ